MYFSTKRYRTDSAGAGSGAIRQLLRIPGLTAMVLAAALIISCSHHPPINPEGPYWKDDDTKGIPEPSFTEPMLEWKTAERVAFDQALELLDMDRNIRKISGNPTQAKNTNCYDEVPNSTWFTNRHGMPQTHLTREEILAGPGTTEGPDTSRVWEVFRPKVGGATPGFWIEDSRGDQYIIKFDPPDNPEMATAAAAMGSRYFHACGYNTPQESIVYWRPDNIRIKEGAIYKDEKGKKRTLTMEFINEILDGVHREPDGTIRSLASLNVGNVKGPFMYEGTRRDDPNDWCPHQHRRDLRGLYVIGSLVNHYDLKDHNSMDVYVGEDGSGYLKHYLMDFGSTFGSDGSKVKIPRKGYANMFDIRDAGVSTITLGLKTWAWQDYKPYEYPSIGYFESELFQPHKWDPINPNPAFEQLTLQDAYWGAKIVMAFSDDDLAAIVESGHLSNPEAAAYLLETLIVRRDKIGRHWFGKVNPLDYPSLSNEGDGFRLEFKDLAVEYGLEPNTATYQFEIHHQGRLIIGPTESSANVVRVGGDDLSKIAAAIDASPGSEIEERLLQLRVKTLREGALWSHPTIFWLHRNPATKEFSIVGIEHPA